LEECKAYNSKESGSEILGRIYNLFLVGTYVKNKTKFTFIIKEEIQLFKLAFIQNDVFSLLQDVELGLKNVETNILKC
jgi:hypothetical protein